MQMRTTRVQSDRRVNDLVSGVCYWEILYVNKGLYTTFYMSTSTRFAVYMLQECCQGKQNIVGLN